MPPHIVFNGQIIDQTEPCISPMDRGFLLGDGVFETLRSYNGYLPFWDLHLERLKYSISQLGFSLTNIPFDRLEDLARRVLSRNALSDAYLRLTVSRGDAISELLPKWGDGEPNWVILTRPLSSHLEVNQKNGIKTIISSIRKNNFSPTARIKTVNYLDLILAKREAVLGGVQEAILLDVKGHVAEAATSNVFWVQKEVLYTPSLNLPILPGVTRRKVLDIAKELGIHCEEGEYNPETLTMSKEAFLTNSLCEVSPLISVDGRIIGNGKPGTITRKLQAEYKGLIHRMFPDAIKTIS